MCYCHTCKKYFQSLGIARHRAMHRDKKQDCTITYSTGLTYEHRCSLLEKTKTTMRKDVESNV